MDTDQSPGNRNATQMVPLTSTPRRNSRIKLMYGDVFSEEQEKFSLLIIILLVHAKQCMYSELGDEDETIQAGSSPAIS